MPEYAFNQGNSSGRTSMLDKLNEYYFNCLQHDSETKGKKIASIVVAANVVEGVDRE